MEGDEGNTVYKNEVQASLVRPDRSVVTADGKKRERIRLKRQLGLVSGISFVMGNMIGSGIFVSPGGVLAGTGSVGLSLIIWALCGLVSILAALCYIELSCIAPSSGGEYVYLLEAYGPLHKFLGPLPAYLYQWATILLIKPCGIGISALTFSTYVTQPFFDSCGPPRFVLVLLAVTAIIAVMFVNCYSVKSGAFMQNALTFVKFVACCSIIVAGAVLLARGNTKHLATGFEGTSASPATVALAFYNGLWAFDGWNSVNFFIEELRNPYKTLPRSIYIGMSLVTVVYMLMNIAYLTVLSPEAVTGSLAVAVTWARYVIPSATMIIPICVAFSTFGSANGNIFCSSRLCFAAARRRHQISVLSTIHRARATPVPAVIFTSLMSVLVVSVANINQLIECFSFLVWIFYLLVFLGLIIMRWTKASISRRFQAPLWIPVVMLFVSLFLVVAPVIEAPKIEFLYAICFLVVGLLTYTVFVYFRISIGLVDYLTIFLQLALRLVYTEVNPDEALAEANMEMEEDDKCS